MICSYDNTGTLSFGAKKEKIEFLYEQILSCVSDFFVYDSPVLYGTFKYLLDTKNQKTGISDVSQFIPMTDENKQEIQEYNFYYDLMEVLFKKGFAFQFFNKRRGDSFVIPEEICQKISGSAKVQGEVEFGKWGNIDIFTSRIISFYGILTAEDFATLWNVRFSENPLSSAQAESHLKKWAEAKKSFVWFDDVKIAAKNFLPKPQAADILKKRQDFELYVPSKEELNEWWNDFSSSDDSQLDYWGRLRSGMEKSCVRQYENFSPEPARNGKRRLVKSPVPHNVLYKKQFYARKRAFVPPEKVCPS